MYEMPNLTLPDLPNELIWTNHADQWSIADGVFHILAPHMTDLFVDPASEFVFDTSPRALFSPDPQFTLSAHVTVEFAATFDAGALMIYADAKYWAKLCFEYSPQGEPMVVSVVNNDVSDDCNSVPVARDNIYLRITRVGQAFAFHYSEDGSYWRLVRYFALRQTADLRIGFSAQSPTGEGCNASFAQIRYQPTAVKNIRSGE